ncbi:MAG: choice-of-anchor L domain-containing protein, partial [Bacteroidia bacterium]|nr:choice-of-anchor L domain-containing protein [Bacteroidia bacterium]
MKKVIYFISLLFLQWFCWGQITINNTVTLTQLINGFVGSGLTVNNPTLNCPSGYAATFTTSGSCNLGINNGVLLATGSATVAQGPNSSGSATGFSYGTSYSDPQLTAIEPSATNDVCILEFDIVPSCSTLFIKYVFGSEEYPEFVGQFNDAFGFFITGPNGACSGTPYNNTNVATLPGGTPVSINNVNASSNSSYYVNNIGGSCIQFDGMTVPITSTVSVCPCATYHFKIGIADALDHAYDSGVFIDMFACNNPITATASTTLSTCGSSCTGAASVTATGGSGSYTYTWLPTGGTSNYASGLCPGNYTVIVANAGGGSCTQTTSIVLNINGPSVPSFSISLSDDTLTCNNPTISANAVNTNSSISTMNYTFTSISTGTSA